MRASTPAQQPVTQRRRQRRQLAFRIALVLLALALLLLGVVVDRVNNQRYLTAQRADTHRQLTHMGDELTGNLYANLQLVRGLVGVINVLPKLDQAQFATAVAPLMRGRSEIRNIAGAPGLVITLMYPMAGNERALGVDYRHVPNQLAAALLARDTHDIVVAGPLPLLQGGTGLVVRLPIFIHPSPDTEQFWGLVSAVIDSDRMFQNVGLTSPQTEVAYALRGRDGSGPQGPVIAGQPGVFDEQPEQIEIALPHGSWLLAAVPRAGWASQADNAWQVRAWLAVLGLLTLAALTAMARTMNRADRAQVQAETTGAQLSSLVENSPDAMVTVHLSGEIVLVNRRTVDLFGWDRHELLTQALTRLLPHPPADDPTDNWATYLSGQSLAASEAHRPLSELAGRHKNGAVIDVELSLSPVTTADGPLVIVVLRDIRDRKAAEARARASEHRVRVIADNLPVLITHVNADQIVTFANATWRDFYEVEPHSMPGKHIRDVLGDKAYEVRRPYIETALASAKRVHYDVLAGAQNHPRQLSVTLIPDLDEQGQVMGLYTLALDVTAQKAHLDLLSTQAHRDPLTGLFNRRGFENRLAEAASRARRSGKLLAVMYIDVDHFKQVNDLHGHTVGDAVLRECAERIRSTLRSSDAAFRLGGDEFVVLLEDMQQAPEATIVAEKLIQTLHEPLQVAGKSLPLSSSIGVALRVGSEDVLNTAELLQRADNALYRAKRSGRDRFVLDTPSQTD